MPNLELFNRRFSCRDFKDEPVKEEDLRAILEAARLSPSSLGLEPWNFFVVQDKAKKEQIAKIAHNQSQVAINSALIIIVSRLDFAQYFESKLKKRDMSVEEVEKRFKTYKPFLESMNAEQSLAYAREQAYLALSSILYAASLLELDTCTIGGFDALKLDEYLKLDRSKQRSTLIVALGKKKEEKIPQKSRFDFDEVVKFL